MKTADIQKDIDAFMADAMRSGEIITRSWLVHKYVAERGVLPEGEYDREFFRIASYYAVEAMAKKAINKVADQETSGNPVQTEIKFIGYEHLRVAYSMKNHHGEVEIVPIHRCTEEQLSTRAEELDAISRGTAAHAREIRQYLSFRAQSSEGTPPVSA